MNDLNQAISRLEAAREAVYSKSIPSLNDDEGRQEWERLVDACDNAAIQL